MKIPRNLRAVLILVIIICCPIESFSTNEKGENSFTVTGRLMSTDNVPLTKMTVRVSPAEQVDENKIHIRMPYSNGLLSFKEALSDNEGNFSIVVDRVYLEPEKAFIIEISKGISNSTMIKNSEGKSIFPAPDNDEFSVGTVPIQVKKSY